SHPGCDNTQQGVLTAIIASVKAISVTAFSAAHGTDATSKLTNVKDGDLTAGSTDAVNGSQLITTNDGVGDTTTNIDTITTNITNLTDAV
ncbi:hypothetical protein O5559_27380, partial [Escherichia coli]|nr:hypothetical protein [Escherichia coli]